MQYLFSSFWLISLHMTVCSPTFQNWTRKKNKIWTDQSQVMKLELWLKIFQQQKSPGPDGFTGKFYKTLEKSYHLAFSNSSKNLQRKEHSPNSICETTITLTLKPDKDITKKEHYRPVSLMNIDIKNLNKILAKWIWQHIKRIIHHDEVEFIPEMQGFFSACKSINVIYYINKQE